MIQEREKTIFEWLRHIQLEWGLNLSQLSALTHIEEEKLTRMLGRSLDESEAEFAATVPPGFETVPPLIGIYRKLSQRYPNRDDQVKWLFTEHKDFGGNKPIDVAASSVANLFWIGYTLDSQGRESK